MESDQLAQLDIPYAGPGTDAGGRSLVQAGALDPWQRRVGDVPDQLVPERVAALALGDTLGEERLAGQPGKRVGDGLADEVGELVGAEPEPEHSRVLDRPLLVRSQAVEPGGDSGVHGLGQRAAVTRDGVGIVGDPAAHLLGEERIATGRLGDLGRHVARSGRQQRGRQLGHRLLAQRSQLDACHFGDFHRSRAGTRPAPACSCTRSATGRRRARV